MGQIEEGIYMSSSSHSALILWFILLLSRQQFFPKIPNLQELNKECFIINSVHHRQCLIIKGKLRGSTLSDIKYS